ncbi:MAG: porin [Bacteroidaceae bacterium]
MAIGKKRCVQGICRWYRIVLSTILVIVLSVGVARGQAPQIHGVLRGKFEYQPDLDKGRFEVRNARLSASGKFLRISEYKLEVDFCDESSIKMKDAWVRLIPYKTLRLAMGQQRMPFSIDAHRNPSVRYFANRSFIAKQVGDMRDVGFQAGYDIIGDDERKVVSLDAGIFNGSNLDNQKTAWFSAPAYSARMQYFPTEHWAIIPSVQHQQIAERKASYTSFDIGGFYEDVNWHVEAEYLHKSYDNRAFSNCSSVDVMMIYKHRLKREKSLVESLSYLGRYDWMQDHSSGQMGFIQDTDGRSIGKLMLTDAERHRMTIGTTLHLRNPYFPTDLRLNYEKYWYPNGGAKESELDKVVCELMIRF